MSQTIHVAYIVARYPQLYHTFIWREIRAVMARGVELTVVPVVNHRATPAELAKTANEPFAGRILRVSFIGLEALHGLAHMFVHQPGICLRILSEIISGTWRQPSALAKSLVLFPKSCAIARQFAARGVQHIHAHWSTHPTTCAYIVSRLTCIPFSFTTHAYDIYQDRILLEPKYRRAAFSVSECRHTIDFIADRIPSLDRSKIHLIYNGLDLERDFGGIVCAPEPGPPLILAVGRLVPTKGFNYLVEAARILFAEGRQLRVLIAGDGPDRKLLAELIGRDDLRGKVELAGPVSEAEVRALIARASATVVPACTPPHGFHDALPTIIMESMAVGTPVITTPVFGIPEVVTDGINGLLAPERDAVALAGAIKRLLDDPALGARLADEGRATVRRMFDNRVSISTLVGLFERSIAKAESAGAP